MVDCWEFQLLCVGMPYGRPDGSESVGFYVWDAIDGLAALGMQACSSYAGLFNFGNYNMVLWYHIMD